MTKLLNRSLSSLLTLLTCLALLAATAGFSGCAGTGKTVAFKTLKTVSDSVDFAMKAFAEATVAGAIDAPTQAKVRALHGEYQAAFKQAVVAAQFDYAAAAPGEVAGLAAQLTALVATYIH